MKTAKVVRVQMGIEDSQDIGQLLEHTSRNMISWMQSKVVCRILWLVTITSWHC